MRLPPAEPAAGGRARVTLALASAAVMLAAADTYVVVLALPDMMAGVGLGIDELQRATPIVSAFLLGYVATLPLIGRVADLRGCRPVLVGCLVLFATGCLVTATADGLTALVTGRAVQGVGGGGLVPATLALVAQIWPAERRGLPLGVVGGVQEAGAAAGPLLGAALLAASGWRAIFWANLAGAVVLGVGLARLAPTSRETTGGWDAAGRWVWRVALGALVVLLLAPDGVTGHVTWGTPWVPVVGDSPWLGPLGLGAGAAASVGAACWLAGPGRRVLPAIDVPGALLLLAALAGIVLAFATADPRESALASRAPVLFAGSAVAAAAFAVRQRRARVPLVPAGAMRSGPARGAMLTNLLTGAALVGALVDVPVFARATTQPGDQWGASLVLLRLLLAIPLGAVGGGWVAGRWGNRWTASAGLTLAAAGLAAMTRWDENTLAAAGGTPELVATGFGFGLAVAPVNAALLAATPAAVHGVASSMVVVARMVGMLTGLSALTAIGLEVFYREQARIGSPLELCPASPSDCPAYADATRAALLGELHAVFAGAAGCALLAAAVALVSLGARSRE